LPTLILTAEQVEKLQNVLADIEIKRRPLFCLYFIIGYSPLPLSRRQFPVPSCQLPAVFPCPLRIKDRQ